LLLNLSVNGAQHRLETPPGRTLLQVLREDLRLTGTKQTCAVGVCGVCSVLLDGELVSACLLLAPLANGRQVTTIEGIADPAENLHPLQQAFIDRAGFQCGICTPGQIVAASALLQECPRPTPDQIKSWMMGNLCRCTGYNGIVESIQAAACGDSSTRSEDQRQDGVGKVSGATQYTADLTLPDVLAVGVLRSPYPHARIVSIDSSAAKALPGVHAVLVGTDLPADVRVGRNMRDMPVLAREKVRFAGEKVAAVAAESADIAEYALSLIQVEYEPLPAVFDPRQAMQPGAPLIHDPALVRAWAVGDQVVADYPNAASAPVFGVSETDVQAALDGADLVFEHTFHTPMQHQAYLEPHACMVKIDQLGVTHIWATNKAPLLLARYLLEGLGLQREQLDIHMLPLGGDFGGKGSFMDIPLAIFLARASGRPVRMVMSYGDELRAGNPRHASTMVMRSGVTRDGRLVARWVRGYFASGGYAAFKPSTDTTLPGFRRGAVGPYEVPVQRTECHMVYTNTVPGGHMRSPGEAQVAYALEVHTDLIARELGLDPVEFRLRNATQHGRPAEEGGPDVPPRVREVLEAAAHGIGLHEPRPDGIGRGLALIEFSTSPGVYAGILHVTRDGQVTIQTPIIENGAGMLSVFRRIVAEELGVPMHSVGIEQSLEGIEDDRGVGGSRTTRLVGKLLIQLSRRVQSHLADLLAAEFGLDRAALEWVPGGFKTADGRSFSFAQATSLLAEPLAESILFRAGERDRSAVFVAQAVEVAVDRETGAITPLRVVTVQEVGRVIDPLLFSRQIEGGQLQSLGYALMEEVSVRDGHVQTANLHEYKIPTQVDTPATQTILVGHDLRLGITPVGEGANAGLAPAITNAVVDLIGAHVLDIPLSPERIRELIATANR
jgi:CO/xanthine dehydrogenase Mo-binding subunit/aerobic-type carbon monoxide dehydrogenase small subunit (CoxS/CutS family)